MSKLIEWCLTNGWSLTIGKVATYTDHVSFQIRKYKGNNNWEVHSTIISLCLLNVAKFDWELAVLQELEGSIKHFESSNTSTSQR